MADETVVISRELLENLIVLIGWTSSYFEALELAERYRTGNTKNIERGALLSELLQNLDIMKGLLNVEQ
jgi:hypothetical protein